MDAAPPDHVAGTDRELNVAVQRNYKTIAVSVRDQDVVETDRIAGALRDEGWDYSNRSFVIRAALVFLSDHLRGKSADEILQYFSARRARKQRTTGQAGQVGQVGRVGRVGSG